MKPAPAPYTVDEANTAANGWRFNCGPAAYGAVTGKGLRDIFDVFKPAGFLNKGYTNPTMMRQLVRGIYRPMAEFTGPDRPPGKFMGIPRARPDQGAVGWTVDKARRSDARQIPSDALDCYPRRLDLRRELSLCRRVGAASRMGSPSRALDHPRVPAKR